MARLIHLFFYGYGGTKYYQTFRTRMKWMDRFKELHV